MRARIAEQFKRLEDNDRLRRELIGNISHDLHTPLASVQGYIETVLLRGDTLDATTREQHLRTALSHSRKLDRRIADLFELSKLDAGRVQPKVEPFRLAELLQDVVQSYRLQAQQRGVKLEFDPAGQGHALVRADIALIERVLQNLVDNALRYTPAGRQRAAGHRGHRRRQQSRCRSATPAWASPPSICRTCSSATGAPRARARAMRHLAAPAWAWRSSSASSNCTAA